MDDNWRQQLDAGMGEELKKLEERARGEGDYCEKHDHWIGEASLCPWCELDALNEKCCIDDLKPSVVVKWPLAARRALLFFNTEREGLRSELADMTSRYSRAATDIASLEAELVASKERIQQLHASHDKKDKRIASLEDRLAEARKDSARLDWLEVRSTRCPLPDENGQAVWVYAINVKAEDAEALRAAIDKARGE